MFHQSPKQYIFVPFNLIYYLIHSKVQNKFKNTNIISNHNNQKVPKLLKIRHFIMDNYGYLDILLSNTELREYISQ